ncbi:PglD-related sugar-binding protein [Pedobacter agri]|uniref:PglD-related sugar-binding protein n=1 Tax=Pedobacter agri TaxID=454586 RepID=UPI0029311204|nr:transferase [Pedobacter agri]
MNKWVVYGGGGHARVIADAIKLNSDFVVNFFDDNEALNELVGKPVMPYHENQAPAAKMIIGIGNNEFRRAISHYIVHEFGSLIHRDAMVADDVLIGEGTVVLAGAVIQSGAVIGKHVVINANVTIDHDVQIGDFCSIYPNSYIGGNAKIGTGVTIEACSAIARMADIPAVFDNIETDLY